MLELVVTRGLYISTHASIKCTLFISYHIKTIYRNVRQNAKTFEDIAEHLAILP